ncbi:MAG: hypothetical protein KKA64_01965 [Nanoarchaeota archaeon]|nr:hypothetical protein [Nanoarchaeota archaeon]
MNVDDVLKKYGSQIEGQIKSSHVDNVNYYGEYTTFKQEMAPELTRFERWCKSLGNVIRLSVSKKDRGRIEKQLKIAHLDVQPEQALTLAAMTFLAAFVIGLFVSVGIFLIKGAGSIANFPSLFFFLVLIFSLFLFYFVQGYPARLANKWRLKASSQMVPCILYIVVYMRHTPNLEKAIAFASEHLEYPLALDFKKVFYDVQVGKFSTIKESLDNYLETWRDFSIEFIESFHLIESSLFEPDNTRRIITLEKSLQVVLDGVYERMLRFTHDVRSPLTNVYMLGIVLPTLGLALLPLASALLKGMIQWVHVLILFNLIIPFFVFYLTDKIMMQRPGGYGETSLLERNPLYPKYASKKPYVKAFLICLPLFILGFLPLIFQYTPLPGLFGIQKDFSFANFGIGLFGEEKIFDFSTTPEGITGPFGLGALLLSLFIPLGVALFFSLAYREKTQEIIKERGKARQLEKEFNTSLFQIGNRLGNGIPPELVFGKVAESSRGLMTEEFFRKVDYNIKQNGMNVERAIFDLRRGAIIYFPSELISTSMRILIESSKKGLKIAAVSLMSISEYLKNIDKINERLRDMLAEVVSDMKSNMTFLAPLLSGVIVGLAAMITAILSKLDLAQLSGQGTELLGQNVAGLTQIFEKTLMIPPYYLQIIIGIYIIQVIFILTSTLVTVDSGEDKLEKTNKTGKNLTAGITLYFITALIALLSLYTLASVVLGGIGG